MDGRIGLITGATGGMGRVVATELARRGATVALVARDLEKGEAVRREIVASTGNASVDLFIADLAEFGDVQRLAAEVRERYPALHVIVNNAGAYDTEHRLNDAGVERNLAVNYFSPFLLTTLLVDALQSGAPSRVVNVASAAMATTLDLDDLRGGRRPVGRRGYATAKLALLMASFALARRLRETGVTVNVLHPGLVATAIGDNAVPRLLRPLVGMAKAAAVRFSLAATPEEGARTTIYLATAPEIAAVTETYFVDGRPHPVPPVATDTDRQEQLWLLTSEVVGRSPGAFAPGPAGVAVAERPDRRVPMPRFLSALFIALQIVLYRLSGGRILGQAMGVTFLLLTTTGRKSGKVYTTPLGYFEHEDGYVIAASNAGQPRNPGWYHNLKGDPRVAIQVGSRVMEAVAEEATGDLRRALWERRVALTPAWNAYTKRTDREFPMVILRPTGRV